MFKKFKNKLAEEMKQSPARIQASMQQFAQAVVSPNISNVSSPGLSASNDNFSLTDEGDETAKNSPAKDYFPNIDLTSLSSNTTGLSRSSSINSLASGDTSGLFPIFESSGSAYHFQSDVEQSASETDECMNRQMDQVSKEEIYSAYRKIQTKYCKYRGKYTELANHYREIERVKLKLESLLVETQNKALRRIGNLKEQCQLEQQAKAHLEEALRNDIEEKDHIIDSLNTKVKLLQANGANSRLENQLNLATNKLGSTRNSSQDLIKISGEEMEDISLKSNQVDPELLTENHQLKNKLEKFEILISKYKESLKRSKEKIEEMEEEKYKTERELEMTKSLSDEKLDELKKDLNEAKEKIDYLNEEINELRKREEESVISLAENKFKIHKELEIKEEQIKYLTLQLKNAIQSKEKIDSDEKSHEINEKGHEMAKDNLDGMKNENLIDIDSDTEKKVGTSDRESKISELNKLIDENKNQSLEISNLRKELDESYEKIAGLNDKIKNSERLFDNFKRDKAEKEKVLVEKIVNYVKIMRKLKKTCEQIKMEVKNNENNVKYQVLNVNKAIFNVLNNYEVQKNTQNNEKNNKLIAEVENMNSKVFDMEKELKKREDNIIIIEEEKENLKKTCNSICEENKEEILKQKNLITKMSEEIGILKGKCEDQGERLNQFNKEKKSIEESFMKELVKLRKLENDCKNLGFDVNEESAGYFYSQISEIMKENGTFRQKFGESEETLAKLMSEYEERTKENVKLGKDLENEKTMLKTHLEKCKAIKAEREKLIEEVSVLNEKIKSLEDVISVKNDFIEQLEELKKEEDCAVTNSSEKIENSFKNETQHNFLKQIEAFNEKVEGLMNIIIAKNDFIDKLKLVNNQKNCIIGELKQNNQKLQSHNEALRNNDSLKEKLEAMMDIIIVKNDFIDQLKLGKNEKINLIEELRQNNADFLSQIETLRKNDDLIEKLQNEQKELKDAKNEFSKSNEELKKADESAQKRIRELEELIKKNTRDELIEEVSVLKEKIKSLEDVISIKDNFIEKLEGLKKEENCTVTDLSEKIEKSLENEPQNNFSTQIKHFNEKVEGLMDIIIAKNDFIDKLRFVQKENNSIVKELKEKIEELERSMEILQKNYVFKEKMDELISIVVVKNEFIDHLKLSKKEKNSVNEQLEQKNRELQSEVESLRNKNVLKEKVAELMEIIVTKNDYINRLKLVKEELVSKNEVLRKNNSLKEKLEAMMDIIIVKNDFIDQLKLVNNEKNGIIEELRQNNTDFLSQIEALRKNDDLIEKLQNEQKELKDAKNEFSKSNEELKKADESAQKRIRELEELIKKNTQEIGDKNMEIESVRNMTEAYKSQVEDLEGKIEKLKKEVDEESRKNDKVNEAAEPNKDNKLHEEEVENLRSMIEKLQVQLKETESMVINCQSKESQIESTNESLKSESDELRKQLETIEEEQRERMNQLVKEFQAQINDKDQELQAALDKKFERQKNYESDLVQQYKEQLRDFQIELTAKSEEIESLRKDQEKDSTTELNKLTELVTRMKTEHESELKQVETRWEEILKDKNNEINELHNEWDKSKREIENISMDTLKNTLASQQRELTELRKLIKLRHDTLEDSTEIEYLRNILYEYMMGKETMVLAKVIAAVVKFDQEQTNRILKKEEDKLTLLGSLGLT